MLTQKAKQAGVGKVSLDLCFIIDATESMGPYIHAAKESVQNVVDEFAHRYGADAAMRFAVLGFRDIEDARPREVLDFTPSQQQLHSFLAALSACTQHQPRPPTGTNTDGWPLEPDWPEDLTGALNDACHLSWSSPTRVAIVITDAPCHGREFYDLSEWGFANEEEANATRRRGRRRRGNSAKDVAFLIDYSGSMAGAKIASARTALRRIFEQHMSEDDYFSLSRFSSTVHRMLPRTRKGEDGGACCTAIGGLVSPDGQTAMNDAICNQLQFVLPASERAQWVVVLTDGEDNRSAASYDETRRRLEACDSLAGLIIVGCGSAPERSLSELVSATQNGSFIGARSESEEDIFEAFEKVAKLIQGGSAGPGGEADGFIRGGGGQQLFGQGSVQAEYVDNHPNGDPKGRDPCQVAVQLRRKKVDLHAFRIEPATDAMWKLIKAAYDKGSHSAFGQPKWCLHTHEAPRGEGTATERFVALVLDTINRSLSASSIRSLTGDNWVGRAATASAAKSRFRPSLSAVLLGEEEAAGAGASAGAGSSTAAPWGAQETAEIYTVHSAGQAVGADTVRMQKAPFAEGAMRAAFWMDPSGCGPLGGGRMVAKEGKRTGAAHNSKEALLGDLDSQLTAERLAERWNRTCAPRLGVPASVKFLPGFVMHFSERKRTDERWIAAERALPNNGADFRKFNNNGGFVDVADEAALANAFSHWTWQVTGGEAMVLDMQGVNLPEGIVCTDAQVQCPDRTRYGRGNRGQQGIADFFAAHRCGPECRQLRLRLPGEIRTASAAAEELETVGGAVLNGELVPEAVRIVSEERSQPRAAGGTTWQAAGGQPIARPQWVPDSDVFRCQSSTETIPTVPVGAVDVAGPAVQPMAASEPLYPTV